MLDGIDYNPDVLTCLANLSNDEVFTPPELVNDILNLLPKELFENKETTFLDPVTKSGVFLREIAKRLMNGLEKEIPDKQERINHIFKNQVFGIAITELTSLLARRSLYCSKTANGKYSICEGFDNEKGNILFDRVEHTWQSGKCKYCGASEKKYARGDELETHAYQFIHTDNPKELFKMKFDVIVGNPPYQLNVGNTSGNSAKAKAIYHKFIDQAIKLNPKYLSMITPSRWMTRSAEGIPDQWIDGMLNDLRIRTLHDFLNAKHCFPGVNIEGGVSYFLWDREYKGKCSYYLHNIEEGGDIEPYVDYLNAKKTGVVIRDITAQFILEKIKNIEHDYFSYEDKNFSGLVSPKDFFTNKTHLTSSWKYYSDQKEGVRTIKYYLNKAIHKRPYAWIKESDIPKNVETIKLHKVYIPAARGATSGSGAQQVLGFPYYGEPGSVCSQTYLVIGYSPKNHNFSKKKCENVISYIQTKFFRYLVSVKKKTQNGARGVYQFVPMQNFSENWTDEKLYKKYGLDEKEIEFIESMIRPMELNNE
jgi:site-specific DNA-methyltransferase (adenine-specific)